MRNDNGMLLQNGRRKTDSRNLQDFITDQTQDKES